MKILYRGFIAGATLTLLFVGLQIAEILLYLEQNTAKMNGLNSRIHQLETLHREQFEKEQEKLESRVELLPLNP